MQPNTLLVSSLLNALCRYVRQKYFPVKWCELVESEEPKFDLDEDAIANHKVISEAHHKILMN